MDFPLDQRGWHSKNTPSPIHSRWTLKDTDQNSVVDLHMSMEKYLSPSYPWKLIVEELFSTILDGESVGIYQRRKGFEGSSHFWRKACYDSMLPEHEYKCHTTPMNVPQTVCHNQGCQPKENYRGLVPCHHQYPDPDSWQGKCLLLDWRRRKRHPQ